MKHKFHIPQHEFGFAVETFNLFADTTLDGERIASERAQAEQARSEAEKAQSRLFSPTSPKERHA